MQSRSLTTPKSRPHGKKPFGHNALDSAKVKLGNQKINLENLGSLQENNVLKDFCTEYFQLTDAYKQDWIQELDLIDALNPKLSRPNSKSQDLLRSKIFRIILGHKDDEHQSPSDHNHRLLDIASPKVRALNEKLFQFISQDSKLAKALISTFTPQRYDKVQTLFQEIDFPKNGCFC